MKYFLNLLFISIIICAQHTAVAQNIRVEDGYNAEKTVTFNIGYLQDAFPFGPENEDNVFLPILEVLNTHYNWEVDNISVAKNPTELGRMSRNGTADLIIGAYSQTKAYEGVELIFPSIINNPVVIITLPDRTGEIQTMADLQKL